MNERDFVRDGEHCTCTPGSAETGWREIRCSDCNQAERRLWGHVVAWSRQKADAIRDHNSTEASP